MVHGRPQEAPGGARKSIYTCFYVLSEGSPEAATDIEPVPRGGGPPIAFHARSEGTEDLRTEDLRSEEKLPG